MSGRDVERDLAEYFRDGPPRESAELPRAAAAARVERHVRLRSGSERSRTVLPLLSLAATIVLAASVLFLVSSRGGLGTGGPSADPSGSPSASPISSAGESASAEASASEGPSASASASPEARPTPTLRAPTAATPSGHFSPAGPAPAYVGVPTGLTIATLLVDGRVLFTGDDTGRDGAALYDPATGKFSATGSPGSHHPRGTATRLADGRVLLAGGGGTTGDYTATAEIYDPSTGKFSPTGSMAVVRYDQAATLLPNGEVLVVGGTTLSTSSEVTARSAELYDPSTGRFKPAGQMTAPRAAPTVVVLADGRVLIAGGFGVNSAEIFDPKTGLFNATGQMATTRSEAAAVLLLDGRVLITGTDGWVAGKPSAELYDPKTGTFSPTSGPMVVNRFSHTATLLYDGRVLIAGGYSNPFARGSANREVLAMTAERNQATAELYDPSTGKFTATGSMSVTRAEHTATRLLDGRVLVADGNNMEGSRAELYQP